MFRTAVKDCTVDGIPISKGTKTLTCMGYIHQEHSGWVDPHVFRPERFISAEYCAKSEAVEIADQKACDELYLPFAAGSMNCIGKGFAMMELKLVLGNFINRYSVEDITGQSMERSLYLSLQLNTESYKIKLSKH